MTPEDHALVVLAEECHEVVQCASKLGHAVSKALRFGVDDGYPGTQRTNLKDMYSEFNQLVAMMELTLEHLEPNKPVLDRVIIDAKKAQFKKFLLYSDHQGRVDHE